MLLVIDLDRALSPIRNPSYPLRSGVQMSSPMAAAVIGATIPYAPCPRTYVCFPPPPLQSSVHAQPSIPSVDRVCDSSSLPLFPSPRVRGAISQTSHPPPRPAIGNPVGPSRELAAPWYQIESGLRLRVDTTGASIHVMGRRGGRQRIEWLDGVLGRSPMQAGRERAAVAFGSRSVEGRSHPLHRPIYRHL